MEICLKILVNINAHQPEECDDNATSHMQRAVVQVALKESAVNKPLTHEDISHADLDFM